MSDEGTRDMAIRANVKVDAHVEDCIRFRAQIAQSFSDTREDIKNITRDINKLQLKAAAALGILISAGKVIDWLLQWHGTK